MKTQTRFLILVFVSLITASTQAQNFIQARTVELGGDVSFSSQSVPAGGGSLSTLSFNPYLGFMTASGFEIGLLPGITSITQGIYSATELNIFLAPSYNFKMTGNTYPYLEFLIGYNSITAKENVSFFGSSANSQTAGGLGIGMGAGLKINLKGNSLLLVKFQYLHQNYKQDITETTFTGTGAYVTNTTTVDQILNTVSLGLGFRIFIESKTGKK